ncbi:tetraspanin-8 [Callorhinchus milii]|uniref:tetraspanin-8 n=1 Tax=Callorhinchus milii TaxID=7868 RepID=UPI001C3FB657|nr:tetraspanin-8 [Callorhinchus milii]XP_007901948.2 tetraspanin-8 [Callorhinchus milii]
MAGVNTCIKYSMFLFNLVFWLCGSVILGVSIWLRVSDTMPENSSLDLPSLYPAVNLMIGIGAIIMVLGFLGCCGAIKESKCMLLLFFIGLFLILALQITAGVLGAVYKSETESKLNDSLHALVPLNTQSEEIKTEIELMQEKFKCCGLLNGYKDWGSKLVPESCKCDIQSSSECIKTPDGSYWSKTCSVKIAEVLEANQMIIIGVAFGLLAVELFGLIFSMILYCQIKNK